MRYPKDRSKAMTRRSIAACALAMAAATVTTATAASAGGGQLQIATGIWCDTALQAESVYRSHLVDGLDLRIAVAVTNAGANDPTACAAGQAIVADAGESRRFVAGNTLMAVKKFAVFAIINNGQPVKVTPKVWFSIQTVGKLTTS